jgi:repressor LexA
MRDITSYQLTRKQYRILTLIRDFQHKHGFSPTMQELAETVSVTKVTIFEHVTQLEKKGLLRRSRHRARSLELTGRVSFPDEESHGLPLVGHIAAGSPIEAVENREEINLDDFFQSRGETFVLKVRGNSMIDEQIRDGDYVVVERRETARNGETVVALLEDGEATLKKYYKEGNRIRLQPANPEFEPIFVDKVQIQGVLLGVLRSYRQN